MLPQYIKFSFTPIQFLKLIIFMTCFLFRFVCVCSWCVFTCVWSYVCWCACVYVYGGKRRTLVLSSIALHPIHWRGISPLKPEFTGSARAALVWRFPIPVSHTEFTDSPSNPEFKELLGIQNLTLMFTDWLFQQSWNCKK